MPPVCVLLTGTIAVDQQMPFVGLRNVRERIADYTRSIRWWLDRTPFPLVFAENSGHPIDLPASPRLEFLQFSYSDPAGIRRGKGYCEGVILERAYAQSRLLRQSELHLKCSGRYVVWPHVVDDFLAVPNALATVPPMEGSTICSVYWVGRPAFFFDYLRPQLATISDVSQPPKCMEHALYQAVQAAIAERKVVVSLKYRARGRSGTTTDLP